MTTSPKRTKGIIEDSRSLIVVTIEPIKEDSVMITIIEVHENRDHTEIIETAGIAEIFRLIETAEIIEERGIIVIVQDRENRNIGIIGTAEIIEILEIVTKMREKDTMWSIKFEVLRCTLLLRDMGICLATVTEL